MNTKKDFLLVTVIGVLAGLLVQLIISNFAGQIQGHAALSLTEIRLLAFFFFVLLAPAALFFFYLIGKKIPVLYQFAKFCAVGSLNSFVDLGVFNFETYLAGGQPSGTLFAIFKAISFFCGTTNSFFWNKAWTFGASKEPGTGGAVKFYLIAIVGGLINVGVATLVYKSGSNSALWLNLVSPIAGIFAALLWDFLGYKYFVFKDFDRS